MKSRNSPRYTEYFKLHLDKELSCIHTMGESLGRRQEGARRLDWRKLSVHQIAPAPVVIGLPITFQQETKEHNVSKKSQNLAAII